MKTHCWVHQWNGNFIKTSDRQNRNNKLQPMVICLESDIFLQKLDKDPGIWTPKIFRFTVYCRHNMLTTVVYLYFKICSSGVDIPT